MAEGESPEIPVPESARERSNVVVFEKAKFPRDHVGESLIPY